MEVRKQLGYLPQEFGVYPKISAYDMLDHIAILKGIRQDRKAMVEELLQRVNLWDVRKKALGGFSGGMKQRCRKNVCRFVGTGKTGPPQRLDRGRFVFRTSGWEKTWQVP